ncbi:hypothetical protein ACFQ1L_19175 [Phytohabitans flavus]|uniref:hypothetical protein n=1 Tax=Phytohabitans flavus TaxID=1076124 RepID=UPI003642EEC8
MFWQVGSAMGVLGTGVKQTVNVPSANDLFFSYDAVQTFYADSRAVSWGGAVAEVEFTSGGQTNKLRYFNKGSRPDYSGVPTDSATTKYIIGQQFADNGIWVSSSRDLDADIAAKFGVSNFTITSVTVGNLQNRIATSPFSNMTSYFGDVELTKGGVNETPTDPEPRRTARRSAVSRAAASPRGASTRRSPCRVSSPASTTRSARTTTGRTRRTGASTSSRCRLTPTATRPPPRASSSGSSITRRRTSPVTWCG